MQTVRWLSFSVFSVLIYMGANDLALADRLQWRCNNSVLDYDRSMMVTISTDADSGMCYYEVSLPPDLASSGSAAATAASLKAAYADTEKRFTILNDKFVPALVASWGATLTATELEKVGGASFAERLPKYAGLFAKCTDSALSGTSFEISEDAFKLSCNLSEDQRVYVMISSLANVSVETRIPLA